MRETSARVDVSTSGTPRQHISRHRHRVDASRSRASRHARGRARATVIALSSSSSDARDDEDATTTSAATTLRSATDLRDALRRTSNARTESSHRANAALRAVSRSISCPRTVGARVRANGGDAGVKNVFPLPLSMAHDDAFARRVAELKTTANETEDVFEALHRRRKEGSKPNARADGLKIGLVVEGGGMRGVISAGACGALLESGYAECFDAAYGSSAGAMNLTYYLANQPEGIRAYEEDLCDGAFLDLSRHVSRRMTVIREAHIDLVRPLVRLGQRSREVFPWTQRARTIETATMEDVGTLAETMVETEDEDDAKYGVEPAMNVHYLVDRVMGGDTGRPLRWDDVISSPVPLKVVATSLDTLTTVILDDFKDVNDLKKCLLASARVPALAGSAPVTHRGHRLVDAAVLEPVPVHAAVMDDCTHVLVLLTAPHKVDTEAAATNGEVGENRRFLGRIRDRLSRIRRARARDVAVAASAPDAEKRSSNGNPHRSTDDGDGSPKPAQSALYRAIRNLLFAPAYMGAVWDLHDAVTAALDSRHGWRERDVFAAPTADSAFHPIKIATVAPDGPASKAMSSLCVDAALVAAAREEGARACLAALGLARDDADDENKDDEGNDDARRRRPPPTHDSALASSP